MTDEELQKAAKDFQDSLQGRFDTIRKIKGQAYSEGVRVVFVAAQLGHVLMQKVPGAQAEKVAETMYGSIVESVHKMLGLAIAKPESNDFYMDVTSILKDWGALQIKANS